MANWFTIPNLSSNRITEQDPWSFDPVVPDNVKTTKENYRDWLTRPSTEHCLYNCSEGLVRGLRIARDNPIVRIHGLVIDYDTRITDNVFRESIADRPGEFQPTRAHQTFSRGRRLIWEFETPALVAHMDMARRFCTIAARKIKAKNFLAGIDLEALQNPATYYDIGTNWETISDVLVPQDFVFNWLYEAGSQGTRQDFDSPVIPVDEVKAELERQFPGRWTGDFVIGATGTRFWEAAADNPRACVVNRYGTGMQCFTGGTAFMSWAAIFGASFIEKYKAETLGSVMGNTWFDGQYYWRKAEDAQWFPWQREEFRIYLKVQHKISASKKTHDPSSEMDNLLYQIHEQKRVQGAFPFVYFKDGPIFLDNERFLNISTVTVLPPAEEESVDWGEDFPWISEFLSVFFPNDAPRNTFLAWLKRAYTSGYIQDPVPGQIMLIAGEAGRGKSLLSNVIVSRLLGGSADASRYFLGEETFTYHILRKPLMTVDDTVPATSVMRHTRYSAMLKKIAANSEHDYQQKFKNAGKIRWLGRVIITCNTDPESIRLLPSMDISNADKVILFRCNNAVPYPLKFPERSKLNRIINSELPFFARWLLEWSPPPEVVGDSRMGVKSYHDPYLIDSATHSENSFSFLELLQIFLRGYSKACSDETIWHGTATDLISQMGMDDTLKPLMVKLTSISVARNLGQLKSKGFPITPEHTRMRRLWHIPLSLALDNEEEELNEKTD